MLTPADRALWRQFFEELQAHAPEFEADEALPVVVVFARVRRRHDDAAEVGLGPGDLSMLTRPGLVGHDLVAILEAAAIVARERGSV